ncbi:delta(7)-sterol-C5(6)-desaturase [Beta vulgaris subsp. vulgaris]|uniref:delta(7)-sterol-C5(6)-desaturase n=1 Tax=Beta vulgaris subsp. vulgaris TaxID=3555 RepID=UPI0025483A8E|nr:delta(7)-sterol-C5(6)-desaturase [Beta vulgaris subsp. vulgaris]
MEYSKLFLEETSLYNQIVLPKQLFSLLPHFLCSWLRTTLCAFVLYPLVAFLCLNFWKRYASDASKETMPSRRVMISQAKGALASIPISTLFSTVFEWMAENGWTKCYPHISVMSWSSYVFYTLIYLILVEFGIYWAHRLMHEIKPIYKYIHAPHHHYSKEIMLSPFAGWSGHPFDGALQEIPYGHHNYGNYTILMDWLFGTLRHPKTTRKAW